MKSFILKGSPWIYLFYSIIIFAIIIYGLCEGEISMLELLFISLFLGFLYCVKEKIYIRFSNKKIFVNMQDKWYSLKMHEMEIDISNIESIEVCKLKLNGLVWFLSMGVIYGTLNSSYNGGLAIILTSCLGFLLLVYPIILWKKCHRKYILHLKSGEIINLRVTPIGYDDTVKLFLYQYVKEKSLKLINDSNSNEDSDEKQNININDLFDSLTSCAFIDMEKSNNSVSNDNETAIQYLEKKGISDDKVGNKNKKKIIKSDYSIHSVDKSKKGYMICPFCANEIKKGAKKCQYCHEFLDEENIKNKIKAYNKNSDN